MSRDKIALQAALQIDTAISSISFEAQFSTGLLGNPPNIDVALELSDGFIVGIESKFSEWLSPKSVSKGPFKSKCFPAGTGLWEERGLQRSQELSDQMNSGATRFRYLDAAQLLKHALGMATQLDDRFSLFYMYLDWPGKESSLHIEGVSQFADFIGPELGFKAITYQRLLLSMHKEQGTDSEYLDYLRERYCDG